VPITETFYRQFLRITWSVGLCCIHFWDNRSEVSWFVLLKRFCSSLLIDGRLFWRISCNCWPVKCESTLTFGGMQRCVLVKGDATTPTQPATRAPTPPPHHPLLVVPYKHNDHIVLLITYLVIDASKAHFSPFLLLFQNISLIRRHSAGLGLPRVVLVSKPVVLILHPNGSRVSWS